MSEAKAYTEEERSRNVAIWTLESIGDDSTLAESLIVQKVMRYEATVAKVEAERDEARAKLSKVQEELSKLRADCKADYHAQLMAENWPP